MVQKKKKKKENDIPPTQIQQISEILKTGSFESSKNKENENSPRNTNNHLNVPEFELSQVTKEELIGQGSFGKHSFFFSNHHYC